MPHDELSSLFSDDKGSTRMFTILRDPKVTQICVNRHDRIFYWDETGQQMVNDALFSGRAQYEAWLNQLLQLTDAGYTDVADANVSVIEASFREDTTDIYGSVHISTSEITRGEPVLTVRKQPRLFVPLDEMLAQHMMSPAMHDFLQQATYGRLNIIVSGASGAGKTTLARALAQYVDSANRIITCEEIDELHLDTLLPNVVALTTYRHRDTDGRSIRETTLEDLVREALRMRADRIWVGETRGKEAFALTKACNSGHDGSVTTVHADDGPQAVRQLVTYTMESGLDEVVARDQVARAFHLVVHVSRERMGKRVIREITELEPVLEGSQQRYNPLFVYDPERETFAQVGHPTRHLQMALARHGVNLAQTR